MDRTIAKDFFPDSERRGRIAAKELPNPGFFTRLGILASMCLALKERPSSGGKPLDGKGVAYLLACCIMMNDLTYPTLEAEGPTPATILTSAIHLHDSTVRANFEADVVRSVHIFEQNAGKLETSSGIHFSGLFCDAVGVDPRMFAEICISLGARYL